jgi:hypothetical protein
MESIMDKNDVKTPETPPIQVVTTDTAALQADIARLQGQLGVLAAAATSEKPEDDQIDIVGNTKAELDKHFEKRAGALLAEQAETNAATQKKLVALERSDDWKEFGPAVDAMILKNGIPASMLSKPGTYEKLLDMVRAENLEKIVTKRIEQAREKEKTAADEATRAAALASPTGTGGSTPTSSAKFNEKQKHIFAKLGLTEEQVAETLKNTEDDGIWVRGRV